MFTKTILAAGVAAFALTGAALAEEKKNGGFEATAGAVTGATAGAVVGGPVGAVVGGVAGAAIGAATSVPEPAREYVVAHPVEPVVIQEKVVVGTVIPETVVVTPIPDQPEFGYIYVENQPVVVDMGSREIVYIN